MDIGAVPPKLGMGEAVSEATNGGSTVIRLIDFNDFRGLNEFPRFPENKSLAFPLHSIDIDNSFIVFISHCWLRGWPGAEGYEMRPHPDNGNHDKFSLCVSGIEKMIENFAFKLEKCYVWLDFGCINQNCDPAGELKQLDEIVRCSDCIFTPIVDVDEWELEHTAEGFFVDYKARAWNHEVHGYLNRGWCRVEMFYAANIPVRPSRKVDLFTAGLHFAAMAGRRPHILYGSREERQDSQPIVLDPLQNSYFEKYHPMKGNLSVKEDMRKIEHLVEGLLPYMKFSKDQYQGECDELGRWHGQGTLTFPDGNTYTGQFREGRMSGIGQYLYANGDCYDGDFRHDVRSGYGVFSFANGNTYSGDFLGGKYCGFGTYTFANGDVYSGEWRDGKKHGYGVFTCVNGFNYDGEWFQDRREGFATYTSSNGDGYVGDFRDNLESGFGVYSYSGGDKYEGQFLGGKKHGFGYFAFSDGDKYEGDFFEGEVQGQGRFWYFNGDKYEGSTVNGSYQGVGTYTYDDGRRYSGQYVENVKHGHGTFWFGRGDNRYEGEFRDDTCCGAGVVHANGSKHTTVLDCVNIAAVIAKYQPPEDEIELDVAKVQILSTSPPRGILPMSKNMRAIETRTLCQTDRGLRYYCGTVIDPRSNPFWLGENSWCSSGICTCGNVCGPTTGCQCRECYRLTFPSEFTVAPAAAVDKAEVSDVQLSSNSSVGSPVFASKWGRVRMAVLTSAKLKSVACDSLPPPPSLLSTRSSRMPSTGNLMPAAAPRTSITKIHIDPTLSPDIFDTDFTHNDVNDSVGQDDDFDLPPPPPLVLVATKSRHSQSHGGSSSQASSIASMKWRKVKSLVSIVGKFATNDNGSAAGTMEQATDSVDDIDDLPPASMLLPSNSSHSVSSAGTSQNILQHARRMSRRASSSDFFLDVGYQGGQRDGEYDGEGKLVYRGGASYSGSFINGRRCGGGIFTYSLVSSYKGDYANDLWSGSGCLEFPNASCYTGSFVDGQRTGEGVFFYIDGGSFVGRFKDGLYEGSGVHSLPNGCIYEGGYRNGRRDGYGRFTFKTSGLCFMGEFRSGLLITGSITTERGFQKAVTS